jgi:D-alanyl-D-alanine carboxypeptidase
MQELVARVNKKSLNVMADRLLMTAGAEAAGGGPPSMEHGIEAMYRWLERSGVDRKEVVLDTGSGLSHKTKLTVRHLVRVLRAATGYYSSQPAPHSLLDPNTYRASLAVGGVDGTLRGRFRSEALKGKVLGKTGTLRDSVALSGLVSDENGNAICFAIVTNGNRWDARGRIRREHEQMVAAMKRYLDAINDTERRTAEASPDKPAATLKSAAADAAESSGEDDESADTESAGTEAGAATGEPSEAAE